MNQIFNQDCLDMNVSDLSLVYLDPPYASVSEDRYYGIGKDINEYLDYMEARLTKIFSFMDKKASNILLHADFKCVHYLKVRADAIFGRNNFQNEIIWCYTNPSSVKAHLPRKHDNILWYGIGDYAFNQEFVPYTGNLRVGGKTSWNSDVKLENYLDKGKKLEDYWTDIPALCRNESEKLGYPTQKPIKLMERIIKMFSNKGDLVCDPFCGSGSFLEAARLLERNFVGYDISLQACEIVKKRLGI